MTQARLSWEEQRKQYLQRTPHYWRDLEVGQEFEPFLFPITEEYVKELMEITGDKNPIYWDDAAARAASFPGKIAPQITAPIYGRLSHLGEKHRPAPGGAVLGMSFWFIQAAQVGDIITSRAKVTAKEDKKGKKLFTFRAESVNQNGELISIMEFTGWVSATDKSVKNE
jgi:acyl dehydratase